MSRKPLPIPPPSPGSKLVQLEGIPGTIGEASRQIRWVGVGDHVSMGQTGSVYRAEVADGTLWAILTQDEVKPGKKLWHLSVSHRGKDNQYDRVPSWDELKHAFYRLVQHDVPFILVFPRRSKGKEDYLDFSKTCLHLWEANGNEVEF